MYITFNLINLILLYVFWNIYKGVPRTTGLSLEYFKGSLDDYDNIPTY